MTHFPVTRCRNDNRQFRAVAEWVIEERGHISSGADRAEKVKIELGAFLYTPLVVFRRLCSRRCSLRACVQDAFIICRCGNVQTWLRPLFPLSSYSIEKPATPTLSTEIGKGATFRK